MKQTNHICSPLKIGQSIKVEWSTCDRNNKGMYSYFYESKKLLSSSMYGEMWQLEKKKRKNSENIFFEALANRFR